MTTTAKPVEGAVDAALNFVDINWAALVGADRDTLVPALCSAIKSRDAAVRRAALEEAVKIVEGYGDGCESPIYHICQDLRSLVKD